MTKRWTAGRRRTTTVGWTAACLALLALPALPGAGPLGAQVGEQGSEGLLPRLPSVTLPAELERVLRDYEREWAEGDAEGLAALFVPDGFVGAPGGWIRGREAIVEHYASAGGPLRLRALDFHTAGDAGWIVGAYGYEPTAGEIDSGKFVLALRRGADGRWLIAADLDRGNRPASPGG